MFDIILGNLVREALLEQATDKPVYTTPTQKHTKQDIDAEYTYVNAARSEVPNIPEVLPLIESFESWYLGLGWWDLEMDAESTFQEAKRRRVAINELLNRRHDPGRVPWDAPPVAAAPPSITSKVKTVLLWTFGVVTVLGIVGSPYVKLATETLKKTSPRTKTNNEEKI